MANVIFYCPGCAFRKEIPQDDIPSNAKQCICPSCRKTFAIVDAIQPLHAKTSEAPNKSSEKAASNEAVEERKTHPTNKLDNLLDSAFVKLDEGDDLEAMALLEEAVKLDSSPKARSFLAYCRAKIKYEFSDAVSVCAHSIKEEPDNADHYFNLARIYLLANKRKSALQTIRKGLKLGPHQGLMREYRKFERRNPLIFSSLPRNHLLNKGFGKLFYRIGFR